MFRLHEGQDYTLYRVYVFSGLAALMGVPIVAALIFRERIPYQAYGIPYLASLTLWVFGILAYWWWVFLFKQVAEQLPAGTKAESVPLIRALRNLTTLHRAMVFHGGDPQAYRAAEWTARWPILAFYGWSNLLVLWIFGFGWASFLEILPSRWRVLLPAGVVTIAVILIIRTPFLAGKSTEVTAQAYLDPLGLQFAESLPIKMNPFAVPTGGQIAVPAGQVVLVGSRHGNPIRINLLDQHSITRILVPVSVFQLHDKQGKLGMVGESPAEIREAIRGLRKAKRWQDVSVTGSAEGIQITRKSSRQNMWLYDLWLAEYLLARLERGRLV